jgi:chemotaxis protein MotA
MELKVNKGIIGGIGIALSGIAVGLLLENGKVNQMLQPTAAMIVFGGTLGAVMVQFPFSVVMQAARQLIGVFMSVNDPASQLIEDLKRYTARARRSGIMSLEPELEIIKDPFLRKSLTLPKVFEAAGGFAPTIGILGAVIGLIQVMQRLDNINEVGKGIAVAFVATIYGVGSANILFLPCAGRIKMMMRRKQVLRELILDGVVAIVNGTSPRALEEKLAVYLTRPAPVAREKNVPAEEVQVAG